MQSNHPTKLGARLTALSGERWCLLLTLAMRLVVGGVFIFSGFVKAVDPWGTCYKLTDYMNALGLGAWSGGVLVGAVALAVAELTLGVALAVGAYRRSVPWLLLLMMAVMTPLTLWLALTNAVADCGCFGDALHLSNWATLGKNVLLVLGLLWLVVFNRSLRGVYGAAVQWLVVVLTAAFGLAVSYCGYFVQPLIDFRPYPVGTHLTAERVVAGDDASEDDYIFVYRRQGQEQEFTIDSLPDEEEGWEYVTRYHARRPQGQVIVQTPGGAGLTILDADGDEVTSDVMSGTRQLLYLFPDLSTVSIAHSYMLNELNDFATARDADVVGLTSATEAQIAEWVDVSMAAYPIYNADDSEIKMLARGNPAVVLVEQGQVVWKRTLSSMPAEQLQDPSLTLAQLGTADYDADGVMTQLLLAYLAALLALLIINRTHVVVRHLWRKTKK